MSGGCTEPRLAARLLRMLDAIDRAADAADRAERSTDALDIITARADEVGELRDAMADAVVLLDGLAHQDALDAAGIPGPLVDRLAEMAAVVREGE